MSRIQLLSILILSLVASIAWTIVCGQDMNFDLITYHYYLGYSAFADRLHLDFLPASFQGYQSPLPYALLYFLDYAGMPPFVNASLHAAIHALNLIFLFLLTEQLVEAKPDGRKHITVITFWSLGVIAPVYWSLVGTSFADLLTSVPVLAGLWLIARTLPHTDRLTFHGHWWIAGGATLVGIAAGIRLHNAIYVLGLLCAITFTRFLDSKSRLRAIRTFALAAFAGWLLFFTPWAYQLYQEFGNPLFPLYNGLFQSADFPASNLPIASFRPDNFSDLFTFPFRIATYAPSVYGETSLPDVRPGLLVICLCAFGLQWLFKCARRAGVTATNDAEPVHGSAATTQYRTFILTFFAASAVLWLASSSNGRYGVALFLLGGPLCSVILSWLLPSRYVLIIVAAVLLWQAALQQLFFRQYRPPSTTWGSQYFDWDIPDRLKREPATLLSFGYRTASTLAPRVNPDSSHVNLIGQYTPGPDTAGSDRIKRIIDRHGLVYAVFDLGLIQQKVPDTNAFKTYFADQARIWGLDFGEDPCDLVRLKRPAANWTWFNHIVGINASDQPLAFAVCRLRPNSPADRQQALTQRKNFQKKIARFGAICPQYFGKPLSFIRVHHTWTVTSFATFEMRLDFHDDGVFYLQQGRAPYATLELGWMTGDEIVAYEPDCTKWFSRLSELAAEATRPGNIAKSR
jgi:hypothetical protein